jgi:hypothetical protein
MANLQQSEQLDNYQQWQLEHYGNVVPPIEVNPDGELFESGIEELNRMAEYMELNAALQLEEVSHV